MEEFPVEVIARQIGELVSHPQYQAMIRELEQADEDERSSLALRLATPDELRRRGIELPPGFRITLRWFENSENPWPITEVEEQSPFTRIAGWTVCGSVGYIACATVGYQR